MPTPTITSASLDKDSYAVGDTATLTVVRADGSTEGRSDSLSIVATGADGTPSATETLTITIEATVGESSTISVSDSSGRVWSQASDDGSQAVFTATI